MSSAVALALGAALGALGLDAFAPAVVGLAGLAAILAVPNAGRLIPARRRVLLAFALGIAAIGIRGVGAGPASTPVALPTGAGPWTAIVVSVGAEKGSSRPAVLALDDPTGLVVAATLPWYPVVGSDDRISVRGSMRLPPEDDYGTYLARIGAAGTLRAEGVELLPPPDGLGRSIEELRRGAAAAIERAVPEPEAGLAAGILIGLRDRVDRELAADFTTAGASHVVAISGWNIAIVATTIGAFAGSIGRRRRSVLTAVAIVAYVGFVGPSPSVVRAGAMAGLVLLARELGRPSRATAALGWAVAGLLLIDPAWVNDAGFRLSVLATAGLMAWGTQLSTTLAGPQPGRVRAWLAESLGVSLAAQAATLPVILLEFGRLSLVAPAVNLAVVPLVAPAMAAGALALGAGLLASLGLPAAIATIGGLPAWALLGGIVGCVRLGAAVPFASLTLGPPWDTIAALSSAALVAVGAVRGAEIVAWVQTRLRGARPTPTAIPARAGSSSRVAARRGVKLAVGALAAATLALGLAIPIDRQVRSR